MFHVSLYHGDRIICMVKAEGGVHGRWGRVNDGLLWGYEMILRVNAHFLSYK